MSDRRVSKEELEAFWRGDKDTYQRMYSDFPCFLLGFRCDNYRHLLCKRKVEEQSS